MAPAIVAATSPIRPAQPIAIERAPTAISLLPPQVPAPAEAQFEPVTAPPSKPLDPAATPSFVVADPANSPADVATLTVTPSARPPVSVRLPDPPAHLAVNAAPVAIAPTSKAQPPRSETLRPVDIAQVSDSEVRSLRVPQLHEPGLAAGGGPSLSSRIAAMQVTPLPSARLRESDRATLLAEAPTRLTLRIGNSAVGKVDFRMTDARTIDVKLSGLLDLLAGHYDAAEFARLRNSGAADAYVSFDQLRALGLSVHYDAVYDELRING